MARSLAPLDDHPHLVLCGAKSELKLRQILARLESLGIVCTPFFEPDLANQLTAFATGPVRGDQRRWLRRYQCLAGENSPAIEPDSEARPPCAVPCGNDQITNNSHEGEA